MAIMEYVTRQLKSQFMTQKKSSENAFNNRALKILRPGRQ